MSKDAVTETKVKCPDGHILQLCSNSQDLNRWGAVCDICEATHTVTAEWGCSRCDFDLCQNCYQLMQPINGVDNNPADRHFSEGNFEAALEAYREQLVELETVVLGTQKHRICAGKIKSIARTLFCLGQTDLALVEAKRALALEEEELGTEHMVYCRTLQLIRSMQHLRNGDGLLARVSLEEPVNSMENNVEGEKETSINRQQEPPLHAETCDENALDTLGVSVHYLENTFMAEVRLTGHDGTSPVHEIETLQDAATMGVIRQKGAQVFSPVDGHLGASYVHCLEREDNVGPANYMLSYSWSYEIGDIVDTLVDFCQSNDLDPKRTYIWIDCLCINQHRVVEQKEAGGTGLLNFEHEFPRKLKKIGHMLAMMAPWNQPIYLTRVWCIFELHTAYDIDVPVSMIMPLKERAKLARDLLGREGLERVLRRASSRQLDAAAHNVQETMLLREELVERVGGGINCLYDALANTKVQNAKASVDSDRSSILQVIERRPGYDELNNRVNNLLRSWVREVIGDVIEERSDTHSTNYADFCNRLGWLLHKNDEADAAMELFQRALSICQALLGPDALDTATCYTNIGSIHYSKGNYNEALTEFTKALSIRVQRLGTNSVGTASVWCNIGNVLLDDGDIDGALPMFRAANAVALNTNHTLAANTYDGIGCALEGKGDMDGALEAYHNALCIRIRKLGKNHVDTAASYSLIGDALLAAGENESALEEYFKCVSIRKSVLGQDHSDTQTCYDSIRTLLEATGTGKKAMEES